MPYRVRVADMFHYTQEEEGYELEPFDTLEAAEETAKEMVERELRHWLCFRMTARELGELWYCFGTEPYIITPAGERRSSFNSSAYVAQRARILCRPHRRLLAEVTRWVRKASGWWRAWWRPPARQAAIIMPQPLFVLPEKALRRRVADLPDPPATSWQQLELWPDVTFGFRLSFPSGSGIYWELPASSS